MKNLKKQTGITLIALVVTIIVLLILAGVSLSLIAGSNGIISKAEKAVKQTNDANILEEVQLVISEGTMQYYLDSTSETLAEYLAKNYSNYETASGAIIDFDENGEITYNTGKETIVLVLDKDGNVKITAKTEGSKIERTVSYDANGGTGNVPSTQTVERKNTVNVDFSTLPTRDGYKFLGWATTNNAPAAQYTENGTKTFLMGVNHVKLYAVWAELAVNAIQPENYGDSANYSANGVEDWKVFLNDGTYIYLISSDLVPNSGLNCALGITKSDTHRVLGDSQNTIINWLTDTSYWVSYADGMFGATATGGPTLAEFVQSYNAKYDTNYSDSTSQAYWGLTNQTDELYNCPKTHSSIYRYWLASPLTSSQDYVWSVGDNGGVLHNFISASNDICGIRPLVRLPDGVTASKNEHNDWTFSK